jgi:hypothetical protein
MTMKNKLLLLIFSTIISLTSLSQSTIHSFANQSGNWSKYYKNWIWNDVKRANISFIIQRNVIIANDEAKSTYTTFDVLWQDGSSISWNAIDERGRSCSVVMFVYNGYDCLMIVYSDVCYRYYY